ncbi:MAG: Hsp20/alpha crystallin family protein [Bdellovibrionota bacterium]
MTNLPGSLLSGKRLLWPLAELDNWLEAPESFSNKSFAIDVIDQPEHYVVKADMPGVLREDIDITLENNTLTIALSAKDSKEERSEGYLHRERWTQTCSRSVRLPKASSSEKCLCRFK